LKKQGVVPLTFVNEADYDKISGCDEVSTEGLAAALKIGSEGGDISSSAVSLVVKKGDGSVVKVPLKHALSKDQCGFVLAGSALNLLAKRNQAS
jgi:homoaconitase